MPLKLMYITNRADVAHIAETTGVDRIFVDMEYIGKEFRQGGLDTVKNHHTINDVQNIRSAINRAKLLVRVNPIHSATEKYCSSEEEIEQVINAGADIVMLPYFKTIEEVRRFILYVHGRAIVLLLLETPEAVEIIDNILTLPGVDEIHIGINDLSIGYRKSFMFELLTDGTIESLCLKCKKAGIPYGFGGIASIGNGKLPAEEILKEHYRLGSSMVILSRTFCNIDNNTKFDEILEKFESGIEGIRAYEKEIAVHSTYFEENQRILSKHVKEIVDEINNR